MLILVAGLITACTKRNPDLCCTTDAECSAIGFSSHAPCDLGVCVKNECTTAPNTCDDDSDCAAGTFCVAGSCTACASSTTCPTAAPVCDAVAHDCRACAQDSECASLACDLAAGTCVDPAEILYASPHGADTDPCTRAAPCALAGAAQRVNSNQSYIALLPGNHTGGASFKDQVVTIAGNGATIEQIDPHTSTIDIEGGVVTIRDIHFEEHLLSNPSGDGVAVLFGRKTTLNINKLTSHTTLLLAIYGGGPNDISLTNSTLSGRSLNNLTDGHITIDRCAFDSELFVRGSLTLTNSILVSQPDSPAITLFDNEQSTSNSTAINNTFIGGRLPCNSNAFRLNSNIMVNTKIEYTPGTCYYSYNLFSPDIVSNSVTNIIGDPKFVDAAAHNFHLRSDSPARDAADPFLVSAAHDYDGTPRPQGPRYDIGAFEFIPATP
ncbi:MAG TPA: choice-of-anchor Q domain-containing protein [Kofleriaceae bacterium]|nr:choice-of-anchor Q domain-containing protein [Kofleriaceae bacterium]